MNLTGCNCEQYGCRQGATPNYDCECECHELRIYIDGACSGNPGPGGWAVWIPELAVELSGGSPHTTNNQMELRAIASALEWAVGDPDAMDSITRIIIVSDSKYAINTSNGTWTPRANFILLRLIWQTRDTLRLRHKQIDWKWVQAHNEDPDNILVDIMARRESIKRKWGQ